MGGRASGCGRQAGGQATSPSSRCCTPRPAPFCQASPPPPCTCRVQQHGTPGRGDRPTLLGEPLASRVAGGSQPVGATVRRHGCDRCRAPNACQRQPPQRQPRQPQPTGEAQQRSGAQRGRQAGQRQHGSCGPQVHAACGEADSAGALGGRDPRRKHRVHRGYEETLVMAGKRLRARGRQSGGLGCLQS